MNWSNTKTKFVVFYPKRNRFFVRDEMYGEYADFLADHITDATLFESIEEISLEWNSLLKKVSYKKGTTPLEIMKVEITETYNWEKIK